jgi:DNA-directed RNA polymerase subunit beta'
VLYFAQYVITEVNEDARSRMIQRHERDLQMRVQRIEGEVQEELSRLEAERDAALAALDQEESVAIQALNDRITEETSQIIAEAQKLQTWIHLNVGKKAPKDEFLSWSEQAVWRAGEIVSKEYDGIVNDLQLLTENRYRELSERWGNVFEADMGAEAIARSWRASIWTRWPRSCATRSETTRSKQRRKKATKRCAWSRTSARAGNRPSG